MEMSLGIMACIRRSPIPWKLSCNLGIHLCGSQFKSSNPIFMFDLYSRKNALLFLYVNVYKSYSCNTWSAGSWITFMIELFTFSHVLKWLWCWCEMIGDLHLWPRTLLPMLFSTDCVAVIIPNFFIDCEILLLCFFLGPVHLFLVTLMVSWVSYCPTKLVFHFFLVSRSLILWLLEIHQD